MAPPKGHAPYNKNGEGGRPKKWNGEKIEELAESLDKWLDDAMKDKNQFWWLDWCFDVGLDQARVHKIAQQSDRFRLSYERAKHWQESIVQRFALTKKFSDNFSKFFLINRYSDNWKAKSEESQNLNATITIIDARNNSAPQIPLQSIPGPSMGSD